MADTANNPHNRYRDYLNNGIRLNPGKRATDE
jgi:hypothetical protein